MTNDAHGGPHQKPTTEECVGNLSHANRATYYWDFYSLTREKDYLIAAATAMKDYRASGGTLFTNLEHSINAAVALT